MKLSLDTLIRIESKIGTSIIGFAQNLSVGNTPIKNLVDFLLPVLRSSGKDFTEADVSKLIWDAGITEAMKACAAILAQGLGAEETDTSGND